MKILVKPHQTLIRLDSDKIVCIAHCSEKNANNGVFQTVNDKEKFFVVDEKNRVVPITENAQNYPQKIKKSFSLKRQLALENFQNFVNDCKKGQSTIHKLILNFNDRAKFI